MLYKRSIEETGEIQALLENIKKEYQESFQPIISRQNSKLYKNPHTVPKLKKIQVNRGLGLAAQNSSLLKKSIEEFEKITGQKPIVTRSKKAVAGFKIRENMDLGLKVTLRDDRMYTFLTKLIFFTFSQIRDFRGLSLRGFDKSGNYTVGIKEQLIFPEIDYDDVDQTQGFSITFILENNSPKFRSKTMDKILDGMVLLKFLRFPFNECGYYQKYTSFSEINQAWDRKKHLKRKRWSQE